jgi:phospho-N-acetylmuramoyl-pentapeptide-transferase
MLSALLSNLGFYWAEWSAFRFAASFAVAFLIVVLFGNKFVHSMRGWQKKGQPIREDGPKTHLAKVGTPTMGGLLIIAAIFGSSIFFMDWFNPSPWIALTALILFGLIGLVDDLGKIKKQSAYSGLSAKTRLGLELLLAVGLAFWIDSVMPAYLPNLSISFPGGFLWPIGIFYFAFAYLVIAGSANATNITDGMDGMLVKVSLPVVLVLTVALFGATHYNFFINGIFLPDAAALYPVLGAAFGALLGFLWINSAPAAIFMGDVGSLAIGGLFGTVAMLLKSEIIFGVAALMMVLILASTFLQTFVYKLTKRNGVGKRVFLMAPLHHHFEQKGWAETKISERFFIMSIVFSAIALALMRI